MPRVFPLKGALLLACFVAMPCNADDSRRDELRSLDEQVQEIKSDVLSIASELNNLEERLLYPSNTQVAVFVELADNESFRLDSLQVSINGELASHHIYSFKELEALQKGGVQRIYTGNLQTGAHALNVRMKGRLPNGNDFDFADDFSFDKGVEPKALGVTLESPGGGNGITIGEW